MIQRTFIAILLCAACLAVGNAAQIDFDTQIIPVLTKLGCNAGACHGAAAGRGNFHLSLLGAEPAADFDAIVYAYQGRRVDLAEPDESLVLAKPTGGLEHGGDMVMSLDSPEAQRLRGWIAAGAQRRRDRMLTSFTIEPQRQTLQPPAPAPHAALQTIQTKIEPSLELLDPLESTPLRATAVFDNGDVEDVTQWVTFTAPDPEAAQWEPDRGAMVVRRRGAHTVLARYLDRVVPVEVVVPLSDLHIDLSREPRASFIDDWILQALTQLRLPPSPPADDAQFLRRVHLDLVGRLPEPDVTRRFLHDSAPDKRAQLIDVLLTSDAFVDYWTYRMARWLDLHSLPNDSLSAETYGAWIRDEVARGGSLKVMAEQLVLATGDTHQVGPANFTRMSADARAQAEHVSRFFLGARMGCANCHNHPLDRWTQDDYHGLAAIFARLDRGPVVRLLPRGAVTNVRTNEPAVPRIPGERFMDTDGDAREELAAWLLSDDRGVFARVMVNRLWQTLLGRGLVHPTDDVRPTNPCTHPELLDALAQDWIHHDYDLRHLLRRIANSYAYQRSPQVNSQNQADDRFYSHGIARPLPPEVLADAIADVTGIPCSAPTDVRSDVPASAAVHADNRRAVHLLDSSRPAPQLDLLGRCSRVSGCDEALESKLGLSARLHLLNGELINARLVDANGRLQKLIRAQATTEQIVTEFYLRALARYPTAVEIAQWSRQIDAETPADSDADLLRDEVVNDKVNNVADDGEANAAGVARAQRYEDFVWALLNSQTFGLNH